MKEKFENVVETLKMTAQMGTMKSGVAGPLFILERSYGGFTIRTLADKFPYISRASIYWIGIEWLVGLERF